MQWSPWWIGDLKGPFYDAAVRAIEEVSAERNIIAYGVRLSLVGLASSRYAGDAAVWGKLDLCGLVHRVTGFAINYRSSRRNFLARVAIVSFGVPSGRLLTCPSLIDPYLDLARDSAACRRGRHAQHDVVPDEASACACSAFAHGPGAWKQLICRIIH